MTFISPIQSIPLIPVIEKAMIAGIPTIIIYRKISGNNFTAYLEANNIEIGENSGRYIISHLQDSANILEINKIPTTRRTKKKALSKDKFIAIKCGEGSTPRNTKNYLLCILICRGIYLLYLAGDRIFYGCSKTGDPFRIFLYSFLMISATI